jgi:integrase
LFVKPDDKTHLSLKRLQNFIGYYRDRIKDPDSTRPLHFHGLRHSCAANWYRDLKEKGFSDYPARKQVATWLGHGRDDVTRIYLASLEKGGEDDA